MITLAIILAILLVLAVVAFGDISVLALSIGLLVKLFRRRR